jgi:UDP-N-acetylglucosamine 2-epimerase (non-hydrolysing)/GDP/UDP-N,N'-diacetylbacillosamine 2-epimerase (hydrolysing)
MSEEAKREITVVTGTRAEYGLLKPAMTAISDHERLALSVVATGMHLSPRHGQTVEEIRSDGFTVDREVMMQLDGDSGVAMAKTLGIGTSGLADIFDSICPDIVLVLGDRDEALAGALAAAHMNIPVAHIHGGDSMHGAVIDDSIRHAITKFAHLHFPASQLSAERVRKLGEEPWRVTICGAPGLDDILTGKYTDPANVVDRYDLDPNTPIALVIQHPLTTQPDRAGEQMAATLNAVTALNVQPIVIYPNADAGGDRMIEEIENSSIDKVGRLFRSLPRSEYLGLMAASDVMIGNSSSGVIEAPSFGIPVVDIGPRQEGRERANNTLNVPHETDEIQQAIERCLTDSTVIERAKESENPYDYGRAGQEICNRLAEVKLDDRLLRKQLTF